MALEQMWQSELFIGLFEQRKALPYQEKALEILKDVQLKIRVYVKRTAYDSPPLNEEEKRIVWNWRSLDARLRRKQELLGKADWGTSAAAVWACFQKAKFGCFRSIESPAIKVKINGLSECYYSGISDLVCPLLLSGIGKGEF